MLDEAVSLSQATSPITRRLSGPCWLGRGANAGGRDKRDTAFGTLQRGVEHLGTAADSMADAESRAAQPPPPPPPGPPPSNAFSLPAAPGSSSYSSGYGSGSGSRFDDRDRDRDRDQYYQQQQHQQQDSTPLGRRRWDDDAGTYTGGSTDGRGSGSGAGRDEGQNGSGDESRARRKRSRWGAEDERVVPANLAPVMPPNLTPEEQENFLRTCCPLLEKRRRWFPNVTARVGSFGWFFPQCKLRLRSWATACGRATSCRRSTNGTAGLSRRHGRPMGNSD